jgi:hypothetical protein
MTPTNRISRYMDERTPPPREPRKVGIPPVPFAAAWSDAERAAYWVGRHDGEFDRLVVRDLRAVFVGLAAGIVIGLVLGGW